MKEKCAFNLTPEIQPNEEKCAFNLNHDSGGACGTITRPLSRRGGSCGAAARGVCRGKAVQVDIRLTLGVERHLVVNQLKVHPLSNLWFQMWST